MLSAVPGNVLFTLTIACLSPVEVATFKPSLVEVKLVAFVPLPTVKVWLTVAFSNVTSFVVENVKFWLSCSIAMFLPAMYVTFPPAFTRAVLVVCSANLSTALVVTLNPALFTKFATALAFKNALLSDTFTVPFGFTVPVVLLTL